MPKKHDKFHSLIIDWMTLVLVQLHPRVLQWQYYGEGRGGWRRGVYAHVIYTALPPNRT